MIFDFLHAIGQILPQDRTKITDLQANEQKRSSDSPVQDKGVKNYWHAKTKEQKIHQKKNQPLGSPKKFLDSPLCVPFVRHRDFDDLFFSHNYLFEGLLCPSSKIVMLKKISTIAHAPLQRSAPPFTRGCDVCGVNKPPLLERMYDVKWMLLVRTNGKVKFCWFGKHVFNTWSL